ncbi:MAG: hypothetical protein ACI835_004676 [Planctomycetota bacterium]|jgi:hypothetical protein
MRLLAFMFEPWANGSDVSILSGINSFLNHQEVLGNEQFAGSSKERETERNTRGDD